ncbi:MAG: Imidazole glycerol phosphate synthase subunit HisH [Candidatus Thorarchaeota archaeon]|nr:MAG: Imidazole glycerol phosphate synthase subunit HisH [Candidatus Thorarchaeota archaeon]
MTQVSILNYQAGNLYSIRNALRRAGASVEVVSVEDLFECDALVIPGVGHFGAAIKNIRPAMDRIRGLIDSGVPVLGICLGLQILFSSSEEGPSTGLDCISGRVVRLPESVKIPHIGWNRVKRKRESVLLDESDDNSWFYFVHSFVGNPTDISVVTGETQYGILFPSIVETGSLYATQFHPEKSGPAGFRLLKRFVRVAKEAGA